MRLEVTGNERALRLPALSQMPGQGQPLRKLNRAGRRGGAQQRQPVLGGSRNGPRSLTPAPTLAGRQTDQSARFQPIEHIPAGNVLELAGGRAPVPQPCQFLG